MRVDAGSDGGATLREREQARLGRRQPRQTALDLRAPT
jgi:hypothetical protein